MTGSYLRYLFAALCLSLSCNAGNYDLAECRPEVKMLAQDSCNALNVDRKDCKSIYQCDPALSACVLGPRDYDRDGDPDIACGGTDCNDYDATISGVNHKCDCDSMMLGQTCSVGAGACTNSATYTCRDKVTYCTTPNPPPAGSDPGYMAKPADNGSWDWDCNSVVDMKCVDAQNNVMPCPPEDCARTYFPSGSMTQTDVNTACTNYCKSYSGANLDNCPQDKVFFCDPSCGKSVYYCKCAKSTVLLSTDCLSTTKPSIMARCK